MRIKPVFRIQDVEAARALVRSRPFATMAPDANHGLAAAVRGTDA